MIEGQSFVYFGPEQWRSMWRNRHHLMARLARGNKVVYVEPRPYVEQTLAAWRGGASVAGMARAPRVSSASDGVCVYTPSALAPLGGPAPLRAVTHTVRRRLLRTDLAKLGVAQPIVWISSPTQHDARLDLDAGLRVYHMVDDYLAYHDLPPSHRDSFARRERDLIEWADLVIAVSPELIESKAGGSAKFRLLPNGFDGDAYRDERRPGLPAILAGLPRPILGYIGLISVRLDLALLDTLAARHPEWTLVMLGDIYEQGCAEGLARLRSRPNVRLLPSVSGDHVPAFVRSFDMGLVPYRLTDETYHASPLKVYEYLAAGLPVVAADVPGARQFASVLTLARSAQEWEAGIASELGCDDTARRLARRAVVAQHTWDARVETLSKHLAEALEAKCASQ